MSFTIPDAGAGISNLQSIFFKEYLEVLVDGIRGQNCVLNGLAVTGNANLIPSVAKGSVISNGSVFAIAAGTVTIGAADATNPRLDLIVVNSSGSLAVRAGTAAAAPKPPARTANDVVIAVAYVPATATSLATGNFIDLRVFPQGPVTLYRNTASTATNTSAAAIELLNKGNSGFSVPDGLLAGAGRRLRVRLGGDILHNSGTPTIRIAILFGGTTFFSDISGASTASAVRSPWFIDFELIATGTAAQVIIGNSQMGLIAAPTAPTTGIGDAWSTAQNTGVIKGSSTVNMDNATNKLSVQLTFSVSNVANEVVVDTEVVELLAVA
jgi:hypothetical protein